VTRIGGAPSAKRKSATQAACMAFVTTMEHAHVLRGLRGWHANGLFAFYHVAMATVLRRINVAVSKVGKALNAAYPFAINHAWRRGANAWLQTLVNLVVSQNARMGERATMGSVNACQRSRRTVQRMRASLERAVKKQSSGLATYAIPVWRKEALGV